MLYFQIKDLTFIIMNKTTDNDDDVQMSDGKKIGN